MRIFERWYFGLCWNLRLVIELILISWRILVSFRGFFEDYIFANEIFQFPWFFFNIRILFNVNGKATDNDTPLVSLDNELLGSNSGALKFCLGFRVLGFQVLVDLKIRLDSHSVLTNQNQWLWPTKVGIHGTLIYSFTFLSDPSSTHMVNMGMYNWESS
jgi:hypothetical protein